MQFDLANLDIEGLNSLFPERPKRNPIAAGLSSGVDSLQGLGYSALGGVSDAVGLDSARDWLNEQAARNALEAQQNGRPDLERIEDQSLGTALPYAAYQISKQVPLMGSIMAANLIPGVGQAATATGLARLGAVAPKVIGGGGLQAGANFAARRAALQAGEALASEALMGTALGYGSLYGESVEGGDPSPFASAALAPFYGLAEAAVPAAVRGALRAPVDIAGNLGTRMLKAGGLGALGESSTELVQNEMEMALNGNVSPEEAFSRRLNSAVAGGIVGGPLGSLGGIRKPLLDLDDQSKPTNLLGGSYNLTTDMGALPPLQERINKNLGLTLPQGMNKSQQAEYAKLFNQAYNQPSGRRAVDPATGVERELTVGELLAREAELEQASAGDVGRVPLTLAPYGPTEGPLVGAVPSVDLETLRSDLGELAAMAEVAQRSGDAAQLEALNAAMRQTFDQIKALETQGVAGQSELFFPNGAPTYGADAGLPNLTTQLAPLQERIDQNLGLTRQGAPRNYPQQFQAAASEPTNLFTQDPATGREIRLDMGQASQIRAGDNVQLTPEQIRAQEVGAAAAQEKQAIEGRKERTAAAGLDPKKVQHVQAWSYIEEALDNGVIDQPEAARLAANVASGIDKVGGIQKYLTGLAATKQALADGNAQETQAALDAVKKKPTNGTPTAQAQQAAPQGPQVPAAGASTAAVSTQAPAATAQAPVAGIDANKTVAVGRKGREKDVTAQQLVTLMGNAAPLEKARIAAAVGFEATVDPTTGAPKLVQIGEPQTLEAIASAESRATGKKVTKEAIRLSLLKFGITPEVIDRVQAVAVDTVSTEELAINPEENGSGFRVETQASKATGQGLIDDGVGETKKQREARAQADEILKAAGPSTALAAADDRPANLPEGAVVTDLRENNPSLIEANIQALLNHREANNAAADWDDGVVSWDALPDTLKVEWIEEYVWNMKANDGEVDFKELEGEQKRIESEYERYRIYEGQQAPTRAISGGNAGAGSRSGMVEGAEAERPQLSDQSSGSRDAEKVTDVEDRPVTPFTQELTTEPVEEKKPAPKPKTVADMVTLGQLRMAGQIWGQYAPEGVKWESQSPEQQKQWAMVAIEQRMPNMADAQAIAEGTFPVAEVQRQKRSARAGITDESNIIDVEARVVDETVRPQVAALPAPQVQQLEKHYGLKRDSAEFLAKVKDDVVLYATKGADAVAGAIRHIIKSIANGVLSVAMIFNPMHITSPEAFVLVPKAEVVTTTREVKAELPSNVKGMSEAGKQAYATLIPALSTQIGEKLITIADKPSGQIFVFDAKGNLVVQKKALFGLAKGDLYKGNNDLPKNRITPAGLFGLKLVDAAKGGSAAKTAGEYDFGKVFAFEDPDAVVTIMHSVWLKEKDAAKRSAALKDANPANSRYSFGCINVDKDTYKFLLDNYQSKMDGSKLFIVPDEQAKVGDFLAGNVPYDKMNRQSVGKTTETVTSVMGGNGATSVSQERTIVGKKEDEAQVEKAKFSKSNKAFKGSDAKALAAELRGFMRVGSLGDRVSVVQSVKDIPAGVQRSVGVTSDTQGFVFGGKAYLIADQIAPGDARAVFLHEVGAHLGMEEILGAHYDKLVDKIIEWAGKNDNSTESQLAIRAMKRVFDAKTSDEQRNSELVAYFIEEAVNAGIEPSALKHGPLRQFLQQVFEAFKRALAKLGVNPDKVTAQDFVDIAYGAARVEMKSEADTSGTQGAQSVAAKTNAKLSIQKPAYMAKAPSELWETAQGAMAWLKDWTFTRGAFTRDLLNKAAELMPAAKTYLDEMQRARVESVKLEREVASIVDDASALAAHERGTGPRSINALIRRMTYENKWAFAPDWVKSVKPDAELAEWFDDGLSKEAQAVVKRVFKHGHDSLLAAQRAAIDSIESEVNPLIDAARANGDLETVKELEKAKVQADGKFRRLIEIRGQTPYAPLRRFGNWAVVVKSKMYQDAQTRGDEAEMDRLSRDGNHYRVEFKSNQLSATARAKALQQELGDVSVQAFERGDDALLYGGESMFKAFSRFRNLAREKIGAVDPSGKQTKAEAEVTTALDKTLASMYMALVAETSARTSEFERKNVAGADMDMMRAFATQGRAMANFIGSLKTSGKIMDTLRTMKKQTYSGTNQAEKSKLYNEILRRHAMGLNYEPNQLLDKSLAANSYWSLITSPSYLLTNLTQPWVVSVPVLAGKFGLGRSSSEMMRAYKEIGRIATKLVDNPDAVKDLPKDVQAVVSELFNRGSIDISLGADLGSFTSGGESELSARTQKILRLPRTLAERGEMVNRVATAVAAYRLAKAQKMSTEDAIDYADKVIYETHGDYSAFNSPRLMRNPVGRFATQFRKFQLIQIALYGRLIKDATKSLDPKERKAAQQALLYTLGTTFALGGLTAMPGYTAISFLAGSVLGLGDDDEPDDPEATLRRLLGGGAEADAILRGVPNLMGLNIGSRIGAAGMLSILPYTDLEASRDGYKDILLGLAGPFFGGTLPKALDGVGLISNGDYWKGLELLMPRGVADAMRGIRFAAEGVSKRNGDVTLSADEINFFEGALQAIGLPPKDITDNQMLRNSQFKADEFYKNRTSQLKRQYVEAYRDGDGATMQEVRQNWMETQDARRRLGIKVQPLSELLKAPQEQRKRESKLQEESLLIG